MKKLDKKLNWAIILSSIAIALSGTMFVLWCCNAGGFEAVDLDTFVGVIVALLAIIVTFVLGWQIFNIFELRNKIDILSQLREQLLDQQEETKQLKKSIRHLLDLTWAERAIDNSDFEDGFFYSIRSLQNTMQLPSCVNASKLLDMMETCAKNIPKNYALDIDSQNTIKGFDEIIRKQCCYGLIQERYEEIYDLFWEKIRKTPKVKK